jgi:hypothetical protein
MAVSSSNFTSKDIKKFKSGYIKGTFTIMFIAALFTIAKLWKQPRCPIVDELRKCDMFTKWNFIQP